MSIFCVRCQELKAIGDDNLLCDNCRGPKPLMTKYVNTDPAFEFLNELIDLNKKLNLKIEQIRITGAYPDCVILPEYRQDLQELSERMGTLFLQLSDALRRTELNK